MSTNEVLTYYNVIHELNQLMNSGAITFKDWRIQRIMIQHAWHDDNLNWVMDNQ